VRKFLIGLIILFNVATVSAFSKQPVYDDTNLRDLISVQQEVINNLERRVKIQKEIIRENQVGIYGLYGATYETKIKI